MPSVVGIYAVVTLAVQGYESFMKQLVIPGFYSWSEFSHAKQMDFNGYLWVREGGNLLIDPVPMSDDDIRFTEAQGGVRWCIITNADHARDVAHLRQHFGFTVAAHSTDAPRLGVPVDERLEDGDEPIPGLHVLHLAHGKTPGEVALWLPERSTLVAGDILQGAPAGALSLPADSKLADPPRAALELRKLLRLPVANLLVGDGHSLFGNAREAILACLEARSDIAIHHVRPAELPWQVVEQQGRYRHELKELSQLSGARKLAYNLRRLPAGGASGPIHFHRAEEELFVVLEGACELQSPSGTIALAEGDLVACPAGELGAHALVNNSSAPCIVFCLSDVITLDESQQTGITDFRYDLVTP